ncbi:MAG: PAS domain-containing sensor histidine kinase [Leptospirillia bacterium]
MDNESTAPSKTETPVHILPDNLPVGVFRTDPEGLCHYVNRKWCEITGLSAAQAMGQGWANALDPRDRERVFEEWNAASKSRLPFSSEYRFLHPDGTVIWVFGQAGEELDEADRLTGYAGTITDITAYKQAEERALESERQLTTLMDNLPGMVYRCANDPDWTLLITNPGCESLTGHSPEVLLSGRINYADLIVPEDAGRVWDGVQKGVEAHLPYTLTYRIRDAAGTEKWVWEQGEGVFSDDGELLFLEGFITDITRQKEADQLRNEKEIAEQSDRAKSAFLSRMSHELRTPINAVLGFAQLLKLNLPEDGGANRGNVDEILKAGEHMMELINDMLDLTRISTGQLPMRVETVPVGPIFDECISMLRPLAENRQVTLAPPACEPEQRVRADQTLLKQVFMNLLSNAVKYNRPGGWVKLECRYAGNGQVTFTISDNGSGIPENRVKKLFQPFERLGAESSTIEGSGLGLSITRQLVERMDGHIGFVHREGGGSLFSVTLPVADEDTS